MDIEFIRQKIRQRAYIIDPQHILMLNKYDVTPDDIEQAVLTGEIIESYPHDLILGFLADRTPLHVACSYWAPKDLIYIHTIYIPDERWEPDYRTRRKGWKER